MLGADGRQDNHGVSGGAENLRLEPRRSAGRIRRLQFPRTLNAEAGPFVHVVFRLLARIFPFEPPPGREGVTAAQLRPRFAGWEARIVVLLFVFAPMSIWICLWGLRAAFPAPAAPSGAVFHASVDPAFFLLPAIFMGLVLVAIPVMGVARLALGSRYSDYLLYGNLLVGFDTVKVWLWTSVLLVAASLVVSAGAAGMHMTLYGDRLELRRFGQSRDTIVPYAQVASVERRGSGTVTLRLRDGRSWSSTDDLSLLTLPDPAVRELVRRTGLQGP